MKTLIARARFPFVPGFVLAAFAVTTLHSQTATPLPQAGVVPAAVAAPQKLAPADLQDLVGPIALYPDALVSLILPASAVPSDITMAARYLKENGDNANVDDQPWDASVRGLAKYPDVLRWMDDNLEWTTSLGEAFVEQPADVMNAVQELRLVAKDNGNLRNTPQQTVVVEKETVPQTEVVREVVRIVPTDPEVIYVPVYNPEVVYVQPYQPDYVTPLITFGVGFAVGAWLNYDCDWNNNNVYWGNGCGWNNRNRWYDRGWNDGNVNVVNNNVTNVNNVTNIVNNGQGQQWQPNANSRRYFERRQQQNIGNARVARANAAIRQPTAQQLRNASQRRETYANRPARVARPQRTAAIRENTAANRPKTGKIGAENNVAARLKNPAGSAASKSSGNRPVNTKPHPKPVTKAPAVAGQSRPDSAAKKPGSSPNRGNAQSSTRPAQKKPSAAPAVNGSASAKPKKSPSESTRAERSGSGANEPRKVDKPRPQQTAQPKPKATQSQPRPQNSQRQKSPPPQQQQQQRSQAQPKAQAQQRPKSEARPPQQQAKPQAKPRPQNAQTQGGGQQPTPKKKKKKTDD